MVILHWNAMRHIKVALRIHITLYSLAATMALTVLVLSDSSLGPHWLSEAFLLYITTQASICFFIKRILVPKNAHARMTGDESPRRHTGKGDQSNSLYSQSLQGVSLNSKIVQVHGYDVPTSGKWNIVNSRDERR